MPPSTQRMRPVSLLAELTSGRDRARHERAMLNNAVRFVDYSPGEMFLLVAWLNEHETTLLAEALDEAGLR